MKLIIDGICYSPSCDESLLQIVKKLGLDNDKFSERPFAAKIAGEVFNLNYVPVRKTENNNDRPSIRTAMAASNGIVQLLRFRDPAGKEVYTRTVQFVVFLALSQLWPRAKATMNCTLGPALYIQVENEPNFSAEILKKQVQKIIEEDIPLIRRRITKEEAITLFTLQDRPDQTRLLQWREAQYFDIYSYGDFADYYYGELAPSTGYLQVWDILPMEGGFLFVFPDEQDANKVGQYRDMPNFFSVCVEGEQWGQLMECKTVADLNEMILSGKVRELIRVNEALHEKRYSQIADMVCDRGCKAVMLAGPSSSGKTTSANRLATQLRVHGKKPILMSLDDYYIDRDKCPLGPDGKLDLEHINTIDTQLFGEHLQKLLAGETVQIPSFNFKTGKREWPEHYLRLDADSVVIIEGLHALNPILLPETLSKDLVFRLYVSALLPLNLDDHNRIPTSYLRLLRRCVRDYETRGASIQQTLSMWDSVRNGEAKWIFPFQENADVIFNSSTLYELAVIKKHIYPLLVAVGPEEECYEQVRGMVKILNYVIETDVDDEIPPTSLVREFIGGNTFYKQ